MKNRVSSETGERLWYLPWFYYWYQQKVLFGGDLWDHMGTPAPDPENGYADIYARILSGCREAEIKASKASGESRVTRPMSAM